MVWGLLVTPALARGPQKRAIVLYYYYKWNRFLRILLLRDARACSLLPFAIDGATLTNKAESCASSIHWAEHISGIGDTSATLNPQECPNPPLVSVLYEAEEPQERQANGTWRQRRQ